MWDAADLVLWPIRKIAAAERQTLRLRNLALARMRGHGRRRSEETMANDAIADHELSVPEMLADPIVQSVMVRDGVTREELEGLIATVCQNLAGSQRQEARRAGPRPGAAAPGLRRSRPQVSRPRRRSP